MTEKRRRVVVVGGGITGLTAAYTIQRKAAERHLPVDLTLIESSHRLGGKIRTVRKDGYVIECGPDSFLTRKKNMGDLIRALGLQQQLVRNAAGQTYVAVRDELYPVPEDSVLGVPTAFTSFALSGLFSWSGKLRAAGDLVLPKSFSEEDQPLGAFFRRRFGSEVVDHLIEPLFSGIYAGDIDKLSLDATFPQFREAEKLHRSLMIGLKKTGAASGPQPLNPEKSIFHTLQGGLVTLVNAFEEALTEASILKGIKVTAIDQSDGLAVLTLNNGSVLEADAVILAVPHQAAYTLFKRHSLLRPFGDMPATTVATAAMAFPGTAMKRTLRGQGFVVSRNSEAAITACTWAHEKWPGSVPEGKLLFRAYIGRKGDEAIVQLPDTEIEKIVLDDLQRIMGISGRPEFTVVSRFQEAMPQYLVGHQERIMHARQELSEAFPMVRLAGSSYEGLGLPDCAAQGKEAAEHVLRSW